MTDGVFMPTTLPTVVGPELRDNYANFFVHFGMDVKFTIDEVVVANDSVAYALTRSNGVQAHLDDGGSSPESNREVFILGKESDKWKFARYLFNKPQ
jgi:ketosteroid isomerase-like protein